jgi:acyl-coenzyme A thioesterase PaaI-like protein
MPAPDVTLNGWGAPRTKSVTWHDPAVLAAAGSAMPGRELLKAISDGRLPPPPMAALVGAEIVSVNEGEVVFRCRPDESTYNPLGMVHGGLLCTMLDTAAGCAVQTLLHGGVG